MAVSDFQTAENRILTQFKETWDTLPAPVPLVFYDNMTTPADEPDRYPPNAAWAKAYVRPNQAPQVAFGDDKARHENIGLVTVEIYAPLGMGTEEVNTLTEKAISAFRRITLEGGIWFRNARSNTVGRNGGYWHTNVVVDYEYDVIV